MIALERPVVWLDREALASLAARASTLYERLGEGYCAAPAPDASGDERGLVEARLARWREVAADGDEARFLLRLDWDGLASQSVRARLGRVALAPGQDLPEWTETLSAALAWMAAPPPDAAPGEARAALDPDQPLPFEELLLPWVGFGLSRLGASAGRACEALEPPARASLARDLLGRLTDLAAPTLGVELMAFRAALADPGLAREAHPPSPPDAASRAFLAWARGPGLASILGDYPVLGRLLATALALWLASTCELLARLSEDARELEAMLGASVARVSELRPGLSDPHDGGRRVVALTFSSGARVVYKPRGLDLDRAWGELLRALAEWGAPWPLRPLRVVTRATHGWVEHVPAVPCETFEETRRFFLRAGGLLALLYVFGATDCHRDNLIACGDQPTLIDLETLLQHRPRPLPTSDPDAWRASALELSRSVLGTRLVPSWLEDREGRAVDASALGGFGPLGSSARSRPNLPRPDDPEGTLEAHSEALVEGFEATWRFLRSVRERLRAPEGPLRALAECEVRFVLRPTRIYARLLSLASEPASLRDGADGSIELEGLCRAWLSSPRRPTLWPLVRAEVEALCRADVPRFFARVEGDALSVAGRTLVGWASASPLEELLSRLQSLDEESLRWQTTLLRHACYARVTDPMAERVASPVAATLEADPWLARDALASRARAIGAELCAQALRGGDGSVAWRGLGYLPAAGVWSLQTLGLGLFDGACGVALFLAALARCTGDREARAVAQAALGSLERWPLTSADAAFEARSGLGARGVGSVVYALARASELLSDPSLLTLADRVASRLSPERIAADRALDVLDGSAGALLGLLALHDRTGDPRTLGLARTCGEHLLGQRVEGEGGLRLWTSTGGRPREGFGRGVSGIAWALLRLARATGDLRFERAAVEALTAARALPLHDRIGWCTGATGVALARLGALGALGADALRSDLEAAVSQVARADPGASIDPPCGGVLGWTEALSWAAVRLDRPELAHRARRNVAWVLARASEAGGFALAPGAPPGLLLPGLFQGLAGVGYQLLRLAYPLEINSILLLE